MRAPIALFTYNRLSHTKNTIEALKRNIGAKESDLFIFSDGWKSEADKALIIELRNYLKTIDGFQSVKITEAEENKGLANSIIEGVSKVLEAYPSIIVLEDDLVTSQYFLDYMHSALGFYKSTEVWSIAGYSPKINIPEDYNFSTYLANRNCSWGWATWRGNWLKTDWDINDFSSFIKSKEKQKQYNIGGNDLTVMLLKQQQGIIDSWSIRFNYAGYKAGLASVYPIQSFIQNSGTDGSGTHVKATKKYNTKLFEKINRKDEFCLPNNLNTNIQKQFRSFYNTSLYRSVINWYKIKKASK